MLGVSRRTYNRQYQQDHKEAIRQRKHQYWIENREQGLARNSKWRKEHPGEVKKAFHKWYLGSKIKVLLHYSKEKLACVKCGESRIACLSIDHINGGGNKHRKSEKIPGSKFYQWLIKNSFPEGFQTLCMNCQFIKRYWNDEDSKIADKWQKTIKE